MVENDNKGNEEIFSKVVRAGKRTYFFDVKATRSGKYYIAITESIRRMDEEQDKFVYTKHKIFLYREDFGKFVEAMNSTMDYVGENSPPEDQARDDSEEGDRKSSGFSDLKYEDLDTEK
jgi:hypothetical protein